MAPISYEQPYMPVHRSSLLAPWDNISATLPPTQVSIMKNPNMQQWQSNSLVNESFG